MKNDLFRKEVIDKITGPEDLSSYVKVLNPKIWLIIIGIAIAIGGLVFFAVATGYPVLELLMGS